MSLLISSVYTYDEDASAYILAVEAADEIASPGIGALEPATRSAINKFVVGCKADGIWAAIKASCILAGARTLDGALVPLVGTAPTNVGPFVSGDYNRKTGLVGDGSTKYLNSNRNNNADPQNSKHVSVYASQLGTGAAAYIGISTNSGAGASLLFQTLTRLHDGASSLYTMQSGFSGITRSLSATYERRNGGALTQLTQTSTTPQNANITIFRNGDTVSNWSSTARLAFYSIGESLDLARLDARVTDLINAFAVTIP